MEIEGFTEDQIAALCEIWKLGKPINVVRFFDRDDIPEDSKREVRKAGSLHGGIQSEAAAYRNMQAQIIIEVAKLDKERWDPLGTVRRESK
jgi:hypothetical protein